MPIFYWDCDVAEPVDYINYPGKLYCIEVSPNGKYMAAGSELGEVIFKRKKLLN